MNRDFDDVDGPQAPGVVWVTDFHDQAAERFAKEILNLGNSPEIPIIVYTNSYGGELGALTAMVSTLQAVENKIITVAMGNAFSCGALLLATGDERYAAPGARIMLHEISGGAYGNVHDIKNTAHETIAVAAYWDFFLAAACKRQVGEVRALFTNQRRDYYMSSVEARDFGLVQKIGVPRLLQQVVTQVRYNVAESLMFEPPPVKKKGGKK